MGASAWRNRAIAQAQSVDRSRIRSLTTVEKIVSSARTLVIERAGEPFTTQELVARSVILPVGVGYRERDCDDVASAVRKVASQLLA